MKFYGMDIRISQNAEDENERLLILGNHGVIINYGEYVVLYPLLRNGKKFVGFRNSNRRESSWVQVEPHPVEVPAPFLPGDITEVVELKVAYPDWKNRFPVSIEDFDGYSFNKEEIVLTAKWTDEDDTDNIRFYKVSWKDLE